MTHPMTPMPPRSLRADVLLGAVLWTAGLFTVAGIVFTAMILRFPSWPRIFHGLFAHIWIGSAIAILCMIAGFTHVKHALAAIEHLRTRPAAVGEQVSRMKRQIDYHLAHARAAASGATPGAHCTVVDAADGLARTLARLHVGRGVSIAVKVAREHAVRAQREDVDEMLGNLL